MAILIPIYGEAERYALEDRIDRELRRIEATVETEFIGELGDWPRIETDIAEPIGTLEITIVGSTEDSYPTKPRGSLFGGTPEDRYLQAIRQLYAILNERAVLLPREPVETLQSDYWEARGEGLHTVPAGKYYPLGEVLPNSLRLLDRSLFSLWKVDQFINLWRAFNSLYNFQYEADNGINPAKVRVEKTLYNHFLGRFDKKDSKDLVETYLEYHDMSWIQDLKTDAKMQTKEGFEELREEGLVEVVNEGTDTEPWIFEDIDYTELLNFDKGIDFWDYYQDENHRAALKELIGFVYDTNRNRIFHGKDPIFVGETVQSMEASIHLIYELLLKSLSDLIVEFE